MTEDTAGQTAMTGEMARYWTAAAAVAGLVFVLSVALGEDSFQRFFGPLPPLVVTLVVIALGAASLRVLGLRGWLPAIPLPLSRLHRPALVGMVFAVPSVVVDSWVQFPEDMNTAWPESLLFYPAMAFLAEVMLHLAPLALLLTALQWDLGRRPGPMRRVVVAVGAVAAVETLFQAADVITTSDQRLVFFVIPQLAAVGCIELAILYRQGFAAMLSFRLGYYLIWHVVWGLARLAVLF